ncbi:MAG: glucosamine-6-phosphate deaminase [Pigmentiphaga sp.]|nr:glucosamine-6-phosphate deaminase [Pigmentiphaga sp.]
MEALSRTNDTIRRDFLKDKLRVKIFTSRNEMGRAAAEDTGAKIKGLLEQKEEINIIFAAAPSQYDFFNHMIDNKTIDWKRINAFHMDEYIGLKADAPQAFGNFLRTNLFSKVPFKHIFYINGMAESPEIECVRYTHLLTTYPPDIVCLGIGENGHIAFNDPPIADFNDPVKIKVVKLDDISRQQQVNDKCFKSLPEVPVHALTLTIPALLQADFMFCIVPTSQKARAVYLTLNDLVSEACPATILRTKKNAILYLDDGSSELL